jgi:hypothetical protein
MEGEDSGEGCFDWATLTLALSHETWARENSKNQVSIMFGGFRYTNTSHEHEHDL